MLRSILEPVATKVTSVNDEEFQTETCGTFRLEGDLWEPAPAVVTPSLQKGDSVELFVENERWDTYAVTNVVMRDGQMISFSIPGQSGIKAATYGESWRLPGMTVEESDAGADYLVRYHPSPLTSHAPPGMPTALLSPPCDRPPRTSSASRSTPASPRTRTSSRSRLGSVRTRPSPRRWGPGRSRSTVSSRETGTTSRC